MHECRREIDIASKLYRTRHNVAQKVEEKKMSECSKKKVIRSSFAGNSLMPEHLKFEHGRNTDHTKKVFMHFARQNAVVSARMVILCSLNSRKSTTTMQKRSSLPSRKDQARQRRRVSP